LSEEKRFKISLIKINSDGTEEENWRSGEDWSEIKEKLRKIDSAIAYTQLWEVQRRISNIEDLLVELLQQSYKEKVLQWLSQHPNVESRYFNAFLYDSNTLRSRLLLQAKEELLAEKKIESLPQGRGKNRIWKVKEA